MITLEAPMLAGSRPRAQQILAKLPKDLSHAVVELHCDSLIAGAASFADEIVREVLVNRRAQRLVIIAASDREFIDYLRDRANVHNVADRLQVRS